MSQEVIVSNGDLSKKPLVAHQSYFRKCYGYDHSEDDKFIINEDEVVNVRKVFKWYLGGKSILGIMNKIKNHGIKSFTGKYK